MPGKTRDNPICSRCSDDSSDGDDSGQPSASSQGASRARTECTLSTMCHYCSSCGVTSHLNPVNWPCMPKFSQAPCGVTSRLNPFSGPACGNFCGAHTSLPVRGTPPLEGSVHGPCLCCARRALFCRGFCRGFCSWLSHAAMTTTTSKVQDDEGATKEAARKFAQVRQ